MKPRKTDGGGASKASNERTSKFDLKRFGRKVQVVLEKDIWELEHLGRKTAQSRAFYLLRILILTFQGLRRNKIPVQAAALTFYSLIGLGPLIALGIMVSGFLVDQGDDNLVSEALAKAISFAAPQLTLDIEDGAEEDAGAGLAPEMTEIIDNFIAAAQSGTVGVVGSLMLFVIGIQVLSSIEGSFNSVWGVDRGRKLGERIVTYWTFITLGAVFGAASLTLFTLSSFQSVAEKLPFGSQFVSVFLFFSPIIVFLLITFLLSMFFRFIPNTQVNWKPALVGAALVVCLLYLYNQFSFLYVQRVVDTRSLYGSVGILVVLMLGLYVFWLLILFGGQITYALQNADFLTNESAWQRTSERTREVISLAVLLIVAERFSTSSPPIRASELHQSLRVPSHMLNSSIQVLCALGYLCAVKGETAGEDRDRAYQPARPLESITLGGFKNDFECHGNNEGADLLAEMDDTVANYLEEISSFKNSDKARLRICDLIKKA